MSQLEKLILRLKSKPRDFTFIEAQNLLLALNYQIDNKGKTSGSAIAFRQQGKGTIMLHKPHPNNKLKMYQIKNLLYTLEKEGLI